MGHDAEEFMEKLPVPTADEKREFLVMSAAGEGIPLVRAGAVRLQECDPPTLKHRICR
jgi:hypothetical protein